jgi:MYXO-CTERM domain-containing protein
MMLLRPSSLAAALVALGFAGSAAAAVTVQVKGSEPHQVMEGFGATTLSLAYGATDNVRADLRPKAIQAVYRDVGLNMGNLEPEPFEASPSNVFAPANDDGDPFNLNASGFNWIQSDNLFNKVVTPAKQYGFDSYWIGPVAGTGFSLSWVNALRGSNYQKFLDEISEHVLALVMHWRDAYSITPRYLQLWNEPLSGNGELVGGSTQELVDIVKAAGARLKSAGFTPRFVVPAEETEAISLSHAASILADPIARPFVGAIAYHPYPYGSTYASVPNILSSSGSANPNAAAVSARNSLRDLGAQHGVPVFMVEVSHSELAFDDFEGVRGRAIQIHDELEYADASAFFGMNAMWDSTSHAQHYAGRSDPGFYSETDTIALINNDTGVVSISPMGHAIGHYARWIKKGAVRLGVTSSDPLVQVSAFRDDAQNRVVVVVINNAATSRQVDLSVKGLMASGSASGEQSTAAAIWSKTAALAIDANSAIHPQVPAKSVSTWALPLDGGAPPDAGAGGLGGGSGAGGASNGGAPSGGASQSSGGNAARAAGGTSTSSGGTPSSSSSGGAPSSGGRATGSGASESGLDGGAAPNHSGDSGGCGCRTTTTSSSPNAALVAIGIGALVARRRTRKRGPTPRR